ncbi:MAG TPA: 6-phosphogluconolactonase, partial [Dermatophilaceae bacterium]
LDAVPLDPSRVHPMPASDGPDGPDVDAAALRYARELAEAARGGHDVPEFDVLMLGVGPDAHVASLFPEHPALHEGDASTIGVRGAPKPPPVRVSMTFPSLCAARDLWFLVAGPDKAGAVGLALSGAGPMQAPAAGAVGLRSTTWLLDRDAATHVPTQLIRLASH